MNVVASVSARSAAAAPAAWRHWRRSAAPRRGSPRTSSRMLVHIFVEQANNKIEALALSHFRSLQRAGLRNAVNGVHTRMSRVLYVRFELGQFGLCGVPMLDESIVALANEGADLLERDSQSLPGNFVREDFEDLGDPGLGHDACSPTSD
jgi:hypothetical protein